MARPEQTEKPTPKRRTEARHKGQVARSADLSGSLTFLTTVIALHIAFSSLIVHFGNGMRWALQHAAIHQELNVSAAFKPFVGWVGNAFLPVGILFGLVATIGVGANLLQVGFHVSLKPLTPNFSRINPLTGLKRLFSPQTLVNLLKQFLKLSIVITLVYQSLQGSAVRMYALAEASPGTVMRVIEGQLFSMSLWFGIFLLAIGLADFLWERHRLEDSLKMTKTEVRDEQKQQEGSREAKQQFRRRARELARRRMLTSVPNATVVVTNPTHFAVALRYEEAEMDAPIVVAKGADLLAKRIRDVAREHNVPIVENAPLARALYSDVELDSMVPVELYSGVAKVIAFVFALRARPSQGSLALPARLGTPNPGTPAPQNLNISRPFIPPADPTIRKSRRKPKGYDTDDSAEP